LTFGTRAGVPPSIAREVLDLTERLCHDRPLSGADRRAVLGLHSNTSGAAAFYCCSRGWFAAGLRFAFRGLARNPLWAAFVCRAGIEMVKRQVRLRFTTTPR
jgi:hypothetical protein